MPRPSLHGREHLLGDVAALQSLDGKHNFPEAALGRISSTVTSGQVSHMFYTDARFSVADSTFEITDLLGFSRRSGEMGSLDLLSPAGHGALEFLRFFWKLVKLLKGMFDDFDGKA